MRVLLMTVCSVAALSAPALANTLPVANQPDSAISSVDLDKAEQAIQFETVGTPHLSNLSAGSGMSLALDGSEATEVSPDGSTVWVGNGQSKDILVLDAETMEQQYRIEAGYLPNQMRFHPDGQKVAVADLDGDRIVVYDAGTREKITSIDLAAAGVRTPGSLLFAPDGSSLFVGARSSGNVAEIDTRSWQLYRVLDAGNDVDDLSFGDTSQAFT